MKIRPWWGGGLGLLLLGIGAIAHLCLGPRLLTPAQLWHALTLVDPSPTDLIIRTVRLPRTLIAIAIGAALGVAGTLTQGLTNNPLASPDLLGISAGGALGMVITLTWWPTVSSGGLIGAALLGAAIVAGAIAVLSVIGPTHGPTIRLIIAGAVLTSFTTALTTGILLLSQRTLDEIRVWLAGSLAGQDWVQGGAIAPLLIFGGLLALGLAPSLTTLSLGEATAQGLGVPVGWIKGGSLVAIICLAGGAVALAGPIGFVGLVVPNGLRLWLGGDYRWLVPMSAIAGSLLLLLADLCARLLIRPQEIPVGILTALVGAPVLILLIRQRSLA